jgi:putative AdoMet-dependent methyltransferase
MKKNPCWYYDEFRQTGIDYADWQEVRAYDLRMQKLRDVRREGACIKDLLHINSSDRILEIGTGTGELALYLSNFCREVVAVDVSPAMIEFARQKAGEHRKSNIRFQIAGFLTYEDEEAFDGIVTQLALHHLPDFWKAAALQRLHGLLKKDGKLYVRDVVYPGHAVDYDGYFAKIISGLRETVSEELAAETEQHIREEFSTLDWIMERLLTESGFLIKEANYSEGFIAEYLCHKK